MSFSFTLYSLKEWFQKRLQGVVSFLCFLNVSANQVTFFSLLVSVFTGFFVFLISKKEETRVYFLVVPLLFFVRIILNILDGLIARKKKQASKFGVIFNEVTDVVSDVLVFASFMFVKEMNIVLMAAFVLLTVLSEFAGTLSFMVRSVRGYEGPMGKPDRLFFFGLVCVLISANLFLDKLNYLLVIANILSAFTFLNRIKSSLKGK